jgi:hypothetical protein
VLRRAHGAPALRRAVRGAPAPAGEHGARGHADAARQRRGEDARDVHSCGGSVGKHSALVLV